MAQLSSSLRLWWPTMTSISTKIWSDHWCVSSVRWTSCSVMKTRVISRSLMIPLRWLAGLHRTLPVVAITLVNQGRQQTMLRNRNWTRIGLILMDHRMAYIWSSLRSFSYPRTKSKATLRKQVIQLSPAPQGPHNHSLIQISRHTRQSNLWRKASLNRLRQSGSMTVTRVGSDRPHRGHSCWTKGCKMRMQWLC